MDPLLERTKSSYKKLTGSVDVHIGIEDREKKRQAEDSWSQSQIKGWRVADKEVVKTVQEGEVKVEQGRRIRARPLPFS